MNRHIGILSLLCLNIAFLTGNAQTVTPEITADELRAHVKFLASDDLEGRASGTDGNRKAAAYIADQMKRYGLKPGGDNGTYYQTFEFVASTKLGTANACTIQSSTFSGGHLVLTPDVDFRPLGFSSNASVSGPVVFAGYGISAAEDNYNDYNDLDVNGKIVVVMRYGPDGNDPHSEFGKFTSLRTKARTAREKGAKALVLITGPMDDEADDLIKLSFDQSFASSGIPAFTMKREAVERIFPDGRKDLKAIQEKIKKDRVPESFEIHGVSMSLTSDVVFVRAKTANVIGYLDGTDPDVKDEAIVVGAHFDHLGFGGEGSGSLVPDVHEIHHGADDNASGSAALLELEQAIAARKETLRRTFIFTAFSGEEIGTLGSSYYVNHPLVPLERTIAMVNMDMVGRLDGKALTIYGTGTSPAWNDLLSSNNSDSTFTLKLVPDGVGPSDHSQFYGKDIPVLFFFTGTHADYHKPSDTWDKINYGGEVLVTRYVESILKSIDANPRPRFERTATTSVSSGGDSRGFSVTLGIVPDYGETSSGMKIGSIRPGGPAEKAGLRSNDVIVMMAGKKVLNIYDYMGILGELKPGDTVDVEVVRDGASVRTTAVMEKRR